MEQQSQSKISKNNTYKSAAKLFGLTLFLLFSLLFEVLLVLPVLAPQKAVSLYGSLGMNRAVLGTLEMQYNRTKKPEDLYNLVVSAAGQNNSKKVLKYTEKLLNHKDFNSFSTQYNKYAIEHAEKDKLYMVASVENYLYGLRVNATFKSNKQEALEQAVTCFKTKNLDSFYFSYYVDQVASSKLNQAEKQQLLKSAAETIYNEKSVLEHIQERFFGYNLEELESIDLLTLEQLWHTKSVQITLKSACGLDTAEDEAALIKLASAISRKLS